MIYDGFMVYKEDFSRFRWDLTVGFDGFDGNFPAKNRFLNLQKHPKTRAEVNLRRGVTLRKIAGNRDVKRRVPSSKVSKQYGKRAWLSQETIWIQGGFPICEYAQP